MPSSVRPAWIHRLLLALHPRAFRDEYGEAIEETLSRRAERAARAGAMARLRFLVREAMGLFGSLARERGSRIARSGGPGGSGDPGPGTSGGAFLRELRHAARRLGRSPAFTGAAALTLALAIGANTTVYAVARGILLSPLPYPESDRLVMLDHGSGTLGLPAGLAMTSGLYVHYRERTSHLESIAIHQPAAFTLTGDGEPVRTTAVSATPSLAEVLRVEPQLGRWFSEAEGELRGPAVALLSHGFWERRFGADTSVLGRTILLNGIGYEVIGVMPEGFAYPERQRPDLWVPLQLGVANVRPTGFNFGGVARLRAGSTVDDLKAEQERLLAQLPERFAGDESARSLIEDAKPFAASRPLKEAMVGSVERTLWTLLGAAALVLLIACANVANLVLVRTEARERELAVRRALGGGPAVLPAMLLSEAALLSLAGGVVGFAFAAVGVRALVTLGPQDLPRLGDVRVDVGVGAFAAALSFGSALLFGALPLLRPAAPLASSLHEKGRGNTSSVPRMRARSVLVAAQVALSLMLLIASGLMARSFQRLSDVDPGFEAESVLAFDVVLPGSGYPSRQLAAAFHDQLLMRLRALPGVVSASATTCAPLAGFCHGDPLEVEGVVRQSGEVPPVASLRRVADGYFETMGMSPVAGRLFEEEDHRAPTRAVVIDQQLAQLYFPGEDPLGKRVSSEYMAPAPDWYTVVGGRPARSHDWAHGRGATSTALLSVAEPYVGRDSQSARRDVRRAHRYAPARACAGRACGARRSGSGRSHRPHHDARRVARP